MSDPPRLAHALTRQHDAPFDPQDAERADAGAGALLPGLAVADDVVEAASATASPSSPASILLVLYVSILISEFLAPYSLHTRNIDFIYAPPQRVHLFHEGRFVGPFVYGLDYKLNMDTLQREYTRRPDAGAADPLLLPRRPLPLLGPVPGSFHLVCPAEGGTLFLLGTDRLGRDMLSRHHLRRAHLADHRPDRRHDQLHARHRDRRPRRLLRRLDRQRRSSASIEVIRSFPHLPLWMALSAALPVTWSPLLIYFGITIILGLIDWTGLARAVRSKLLRAARGGFLHRRRADGRLAAPHHRPPPAAELHEPPDRLGDPGDPGMILGETALSFLGLGLRPPITQLGRAAERGAEHQRRGALSLAAAAGGAGDHHRARLQLPRRRPARRGRPVPASRPSRATGWSRARRGRSGSRSRPRRATSAAIRVAA